MIEAFLLFLETNRMQVFWRVNYHLRVSDAGAQGWAGLAGTTPGRQNNLLPEREWVAAGSWSLPQPVLRKSHSPDVFQTDIPTGAWPGNLDESRSPPSLSRRCPVAIAQGLVGTNLSCLETLFSHPTSPFASQLRGWDGLAGPHCAKETSVPLCGLRLSYPTHHMSREWEEATPSWGFGQFSSGVDSYAMAGRLLMRSAFTQFSQPAGSLQPCSLSCPLALGTGSSWAHVRTPVYSLPWFYRTSGHWPSSCMACGVGWLEKPQQSPKHLCHPHLPWRWSACWNVLCSLGSRVGSSRVPIAWFRKVTVFLSFPSSAPISYLGDDYFV